MYNMLMSRSTDRRDQLEYPKGCEILMYPKDIGGVHICQAA